MGKSILRDRRTPFTSAGPRAAAYRKGMGLRFPNRDVDTGRQRKLDRGRQREFRRELSFLVNRAGSHPGIALGGDRVRALGQRRHMGAVRCALDGP
jgi:hypothetical protein